MRRFIPLLCLFVTSITLISLITSNSLLADDSIIISLEDAKQRYQSQIEEVREAFLRSLDRQEQSARSRASNDEIINIAKIRENYSKSNQIPVTAPRDIALKMNTAQRRLEIAFETAVKAFTRNGDDAAAKDIGREARTYFRPTDAAEFNDGFYKVYIEEITWEQAFARCKSMKGQMVAIQSEEENTFITRISKDAGVECLWIGATDKLNEGLWTWTSGEALTYTNWKVREPNNYRGLEDYANLRVSENGLWHDTPNFEDTRPIGFVCVWR